MVQTNSANNGERDAGDNYPSLNFMRDMSQGEGGALDFFERASGALGDRLSETWSERNIDRMAAKLDGEISGLGSLLKEIFNMASGFMSGTLAELGMDPNANDEISAAVYGSAEPSSEGARMAANFLQRDDNSLAAVASIGSGTGGGIMELNGIQYGPDGKPLNGDDDVDEFEEQMSQVAEARERAWDQSRVNVGGIELSGEEWDRVNDEFSDEEASQEIEDELTAKYGGDRRRAKKAVQDGRQLSQIAQRQKNGTDTSADHQRADDIVRSNPDAADAIKVAQRRAEADHASKPLVSNSSIAEAQAGSRKSMSIGQADDIIASRAEFNAEPITPKYNAAALGISDQPAPATPSADQPQKIEVAAATPPPVATGMNASLDMG